jgi:hypothetical protein
MVLRPFHHRRRPIVATDGPRARAVKPRERVTGAGGTIGVDNRPGGGFTVRVGLPLPDGSP